MFLGPLASDRLGTREDLEELNENIVGFIEVVGEYRGPA